MDACPVAVTAVTGPSAYPTTKKDYAMNEHNQTVRVDDVIREVAS